MQISNPLSHMVHHLNSQDQVSAFIHLSTSEIRFFFPPGSFISNLYIKHKLLISSASSRVLYRHIWFTPYTQLHYSVSPIHHMGGHIQIPKVYLFYQRNNIII